MMKDISLRPKKQLMNLFEAVQNLDNQPSTNRNSIIDRALDVALNTRYINWQSVSEVSIEDNFNSHVPIHIVLKVDEEKFARVNKQIKETFQVDKITIPYTLKLLLTLYFIHLKQQSDSANQNDNINEILKSDSKVSESRIDTLALKNVYEQSLYSGKKRLFEMCRVFLKNHPNINEQLTYQSSCDLNKYAGFIDLDKYFAGKMHESNPTSTYLAQVLAGLFILRIERISESDKSSKNMLDQIVKQLETEFQILGEAVNHIDSADYYKDVYAKVMGRKV